MTIYVTGVAKISAPQMLLNHKIFQLYYWYPTFEKNPIDIWLQTTSGTQTYAP